jgi:hypothetical protein
MRYLVVGFGIFLFAATAFCQSDRGTITGTVTDSTGAVLSGAELKLRNVETGALYPGATSATGNYTLGQLPAGQYEMSVEVPGFKTYVRRGLTVDVAQTYRVDVALEVGSRAESVTVTEAAPLVKTDSGELSHNITVNALDDLPVLPTGSQAGADMTVRVNGAPANTQAMLIEGQDATNGWYRTQSQTQPSVEAIQEFAVQTSNFSAEFGQVGGGLFNTTMKSGTNQYHGSAYDYFVNEAVMGL